MLNIYIIGPSCAGKTSSIEYLKSQNDELFNFPLRVITRPKRNYDESNENTFLDKEKFRKKRENNNDFFMSWVRSMEDDRKEYYGFYEDGVRDGVNIFSCNNAILLNNDSIQPRNILEKHKSLVVALWAPADVRLERIKRRTPEYTGKVKEYRIHEEPLEGCYDKIDLKLDNYDQPIEKTGEELYKIIKSRY
ncbi:MAG: hypothetical protein ABEJ24_04065 [Candidatus Magasanikbacteria bacterium]